MGFTLCLILLYTFNRPMKNKSYQEASQNRSEIPQPSISDDTRTLLAKETDAPPQVPRVVVRDSFKEAYCNSLLLTGTVIVDINNYNYYCTTAVLL